MLHLAFYFIIIFLTFDLPLFETNLLEFWIFFPK